MRNLGIQTGHGTPGRFNAITDISGVQVGHTTILDGSTCTGVTAVIPCTDVYLNRPVAGAYILNGAGEFTGLIQAQEWGLVETPILLTNSLSIGVCVDACTQYLLKKYPELGVSQDVVLPLVGECDDSWLNDIRACAVKPTHVFEALEKASGGPVNQGAVGAGTGMTSFDLKSGIGTASRLIHLHSQTFTLGALVLNNFGNGDLQNLMVAGVPVGKLLKEKPEALHTEPIHNDGSIIVILATDAPLHTHQLQRIAKRASLGIARVGGYAAHQSGEIMLAFSTTNKVTRTHNELFQKLSLLSDSYLNPFFEATVEATEEAILNSLFNTKPTHGKNGRFVDALPTVLAHLQDVLPFQLPPLQ